MYDVAGTPNVHATASRAVCTAGGTCRKYSYHDPSGSDVELTTFSSASGSSSANSTR